MQYPGTAAWNLFRAHYQCVCIGPNAAAKALFSSPLCLCVLPEQPQPLAPQLLLGQQLLQPLLSQAGLEPLRLHSCLQPTHLHKCEWQLKPMGMLELQKHWNETRWSLRHAKALQALQHHVKHNNSHGYAEAPMVLRMKRVTAVLIMRKKPRCAPHYRALDLQSCVPRKQPLPRAVIARKSHHDDRLSMSACAVSMILAGGYFVQTAW